eukprot:4272228-Amphidinium_carterae.1
MQVVPARCKLGLNNLSSSNSTRQPNCNCVSCALSVERTPARCSVCSLECGWSTALCTLLLGMWRRHHYMWDGALHESKGGGEIISSTT